MAVCYNGAAASGNYGILNFVNATSDSNYSSKAAAYDAVCKAMWNKYDPTFFQGDLSGKYGYTYAPAPFKMSDADAALLYNQIDW